ncbi:hypothetical protein NW752_009529 [Fusarium irregulare]|uniref:Ankyrin n=1 Tax=Fusarium irregulare TaxID=2494466 RepID=A0A9W8PG37_9HYPO|nr:hypothetical protein NW766_011539 [Fusarium irregulare]KAJ4009230.1 hypothetical protein NW752_009529 [Fusarium irregulare]
MEAAGLAIGIVGIAGLFNTCLDSLSRFQAYKSSTADSHILDTRFRAARARFEKWGHGVGISEGRLLSDHNPGLDDRKTAGVVQDILHIIAKAICDDGSSLQNEQFAGLQSRRKRMKWALGGKEDRTEQVDIFEKLVQQLYNLVPVDGQGREQIGEQKSEDWSDVKKILLNIEQGMKNEMRRDVYSWLGVPSSSDKYQDSLDERVENTCGWIFDRDEFKAWVSPDDASSPSLLWINGPAGFGKTILCAHIAQHLSQTLITPVAYFFFTSNQDTPYLALRSWIHQIAEARQDAFECVYRAWEAYHAEMASRRNVIDIFTAVVEAVPGCTFIADGLDECSQLGSGDSSVTRFLSDVVSAASKHNLRLLFVSRDEPEIRDALDESTESFAEYKVVLGDTRSDTAAFSQFIVDKKLSNKSEDIRSTISEAMTDRCEGQFLWIRMQEQSLRKGMSKKRLHEAVENTPPGLDRLYDHNWNRIMAISDFEKDRVFALLRWAAFARRNLSVYEITEAALMEQFEELDPDEYPDEIDEDYIRTEIVGLCSPLLEVKDLFVHIPHFSVRQYLGQHLPLPSWLNQNGQLQSSYEKLHHAVLAKACLLYIGLPQTWKDEFRYYNRRMTLRCYASMQWVYHANDSGCDPSSFSPVWELAEDLLREDNPLWKPLSNYVAAVLARDRTEVVGIDSPFHPLEHILNFGWKDMAISLISEQNVNRVGSLGRTPLMRASEQEDMSDMVERLLEAGADVGAVDENKHTSLHRAAWNGLEENVRILVNHGADLTAQEDQGWTPLHAAVVNGTPKTCEYLIKGGSDLTIKDHKGMLPLHMAYHDAGRADLARMILQHGPASMVLENSIVGPPLHFTCVKGDVEMARLLLEHGAAPSLTYLNKDGATALMMAAERGNIELAKLFFEYGADTTLSFATEEYKLTLLHFLCIKKEEVEWFETVLRPGVEASLLMGDVKGRTPLHIACQNGTIHAVELILGYRGGNVKAMIEAKSTQLWTPLWLAARNGHLEIVKILLDHGAAETIAAVSDEGKTALWLASRYGHTDLVQELLKRGAEETVAIKSVDGDTALWMASHHGHTDIVKLLLEHGAASTIAVGDVNSETPLHTASSKGHLEIVKMLLSHGDGSAVGMLDAHSKTPLYEAAENGHVEVVRELLANGAVSTITTLTWFENSPLYAACLSGKVEIVKQLLDHGAASTVNLVNKEGNTSLHAATYQDNIEMTRLLLKHGAEKSVTVLDKNNGDSPLYNAALNASMEMVDLLLDHGAETTVAMLTKDGRSILYAVAEGGSWELYQKLLAYPEAESTTALLDDKNKSLLIAAATGGCVEIVKDLLNRDASEHAALPNKAEETPLLLAAHNDFVDIVQLLIDIPEYPVNHPTNYGVTPLFAASRFGHLETVKILLTRDDIDLDCENWKALTPLYAAVANGHLEVAELLITNGATLDAWPTVGQPLLWWAQRSGAPGMVSLLHNHGMRRDTIGPYRYYRRKEPEEDAPRVLFDESKGYCDVCTLTIHDGKAYGCNKCWYEFAEDMLVCKECFEREYDVCRNDHALLPKKELDY